MGSTICLSCELFCHSLANSTRPAKALTAAPMFATPISRISSIAVLNPKQPIVFKVPHSYRPASGRSVMSRDAEISFMLFQNAHMHG